MHEEILWLHWTNYWSENHWNFLCDLQHHSNNYLLCGNCRLSSVPRLHQKYLAGLDGIWVRFVGSSQIESNYIFSKFFTDAKFNLFFFLIAYIVNLVGSVLLVIGAQTKNSNCMMPWLCCEFLMLFLNFCFMSYFKISLLIIPIAFDIYSFICIFSLIHQWDGEVDRSKPQDQVEQGDQVHQVYQAHGHSQFHCHCPCKGACELICCFCELLALLK